MDVPNHARLLYHFTPLADLDGLLARRELPVESQATARRVRRLRRPPAVVWLSDLGELTPEQLDGAATVRPGLAAPAAELARVTVGVRDAQYWPQWARRYRVSRRRQRAIDDAADGLSGRWWVVARPVDVAEWVQIETIAGRLLWPPDDQRAALPADHRRVTRTAG